MVDFDFIHELEGWRLRGYVPDAGSSKSGVTVGAGVDLGHWSEAQLRRRKISDALIAKLRPYLGLRGDDAIELADELVLTIDEAERLSSAIQGDILSALKSRYRRAQRPGTLKWEVLPMRFKTVLASVAYQYGPALNRRTPNFWLAAVNQDWQGMVWELRHFRDRYPTRRNKEADFLAPIIA